MNNETEDNLSKLQSNFETLFTDYQGLKQNLNDIVKVIIAKDREWDMTSVLAAVESSNNPSS
jgi:chaperonin cofactor prefoldin